MNTPNIHLTPEEQETIKTYDFNAEHWSQENYHQGLWTGDIAILKSFLPKGKILEIGSGSGTDAKGITNAGYKYIGTDASLKLVQEARQKNPGTVFIHKNVYELDFPNESFDGFWAAAILLHIPKNKLSAALTKIHNAVRSGGIGFITVKEGTGELLTEEDASDGKVYKRLFSFYTLDEIAGQLKKNNFEILQTRKFKLNEKVTWLKLFVKRI